MFKVESGSCLRFVEKFLVLIVCVFKILLFINIDLIVRIWLDVLLYCNEFCFDVLVLIILFSVVWLLVESLGEKNKLCGLRNWLSWFFIIFVCMWI